MLTPTADHHWEVNVVGFIQRRVTKAGRSVLFRIAWSHVLKSLDEVYWPPALETGQIIQSGLRSRIPIFSRPIQSYIVVKQCETLVSGNNSIDVLDWTRHRGGRHP
jgi:hypothetical protein